jgi:predicted component of type VI protein secretion system
MAKLVLHQPDGRMRDIRLDHDRMTIGRRPDNDLCLQYPTVSADHTEIITIAGDSFLHDCGSTNGTLVNGHPVTKHFLRDHDVIDIGRLKLVYLADEAETVAPLPPDTSHDVMEGLIERARTSATQQEVVAEPDDEPPAPVDELLSELMEADADASVAVEMPPTVSVVRPAPKPSTRAAASGRDAGPARDAPVIEVLSGPNAGQRTKMTKAQFVLGKGGVTIASIRRDDSGYRLVRDDAHAVAALNGVAITGSDARLAFGDTIEVAGVKLRFSADATAPGDQPSPGHSM